MKLSITIVIFFFAFAFKGMTQPLCAMPIKFKIKISKTNLVPSKIALPKIISLEERNGNDSLEFDTYKVITSEIYKTMGIGCNYCFSDFVKDSIIIKNRKELPIEIYFKAQEYPVKMTIPFSQIQFREIRERKETIFIIDMGNVKI